MTQVGCSQDTRAAQAPLFGLKYKKFCLIDCSSQTPHITSGTMSVISGPITKERALTALGHSRSSYRDSPTNSPKSSSPNSLANSSNNPLSDSVDSDSREMDLLEALMIAHANILALQDKITPKSAPSPCVQEDLPSPYGTIGPLDQELKKILNHLECLQSFTKWCETRHCEENVHFWVDVEILRNIPTEKFKDQVEQVYERYFMGDEQSINIDSVSMLKLADEHRQRSLKTSSFDDMQEQVFRLLESDCTRKYLESNEYKIWREEYTMKKRKDMKASFFASIWKSPRPNGPSRLMARHTATETTNIERLFALRAASPGNEGTWVMHDWVDDRRIFQGILSNKCSVTSVSVYHTWVYSPTITRRANLSSRRLAKAVYCSCPVNVSTLTYARYSPRWV
ncbi:hypothetical protein PROFUN_15441 [Planoprotostelium fungivorum]|uniref:RGS domain-containing protein n=1 Tax=Planoprotostelium fungivorum TaxID=1890364 RepID=A0A2P6MWK8_9EUKA|nr:hypothetical protein PROFUN_15441 [Planoprotostelium fungivorum]